jgi:hypothetical protein
MELVLYILGIFIITLGVMIVFLGNNGLSSIDFSIVVNAIIGGVFFLALGKIVEVLVKIEKKLPALKYADEFQPIEFKVVSNDFEVYESNNETYQFFDLDGNEFIQARVFKNYLVITEKSFVFKLPNSEQIEFQVMKYYSPTADMFARDEIIFVKLMSLNMKATRNGNLITLSSI